MILRTKTTKSNLNVKIGDTFELILSNVNNNNELVKTLVKVIDIPKKEERCSGCKCILHEKVEFMKKFWCQDCVKREKERRSKIQMAHPVSKNAFGGNVSKMKNKFE